MVSALQSQSVQPSPASAPSAKQVNWSHTALNLFLKIYLTGTSQEEFQREVENLHITVSHVMMMHRPDCNLLTRNKRLIDETVGDLYRKVMTTRQTNPVEAINELVQSSIFVALTEEQAAKDQKENKALYQFNYKYLAPRQIKKIPELAGSPAILDWLTRVTLANSPHKNLEKISQPMADLPPEIIEYVLDERTEIGEYLLSGDLSSDDVNLLLQFMKNQKVQVVWQRIAKLFEKTDPHGQAFRSSYIEGLTFLSAKLAAAIREAGQNEASKQKVD